MPDFDHHLRQAKHNESLLGFLTEANAATRFSDWYVTVVFYTGLHYVEAIIFSSRVGFSISKSSRVTINAEHSSDFLMAMGTKSEHHARNMVIRANPGLFSEINDAYISLYEMSRTARYRCHDPMDHDYPQSEDYLATIVRTFERVQKARATNEPA